ncbi:outer membrane protein OmpK [Vibrio agarivorans]|uniref:outer membrane protein OmpK n=1 Tax=Vibrio agarivorans TaxID=153622 RepID=UPI00222F6A1B|nr:outer membrane protein OmpK [Vibrio agarivorans]MDN3661420.1 outer membrane protein OmpK [Vibrio agarivorans]
MRKSLLSLAMIAAAAATSAQAEKLYDFGSVSLNHIEWFDANPHHDQLGFLEVEYGAGYTWGSHYGFIDFETTYPDKGLSVKQNVALNIGQSDFAVYGQVFHAQSLESGNDFYSTDWVAGLQYNGFDFGKILFKPFLGAVYSNNDSNSADFNGAMYGHLLVLPINEQFSITNWHETQFAKDSKFDGKSYSHNGAIAAWYHTPVENFDLGLQYRYGYHKLGTYAQDGNYGAIFTAKYNF